jgi:hypothetical protein
MDVLPVIVGLKRNRLKPMHFAMAIGAEADRVWLNESHAQKGDAC